MHHAHPVGQAGDERVGQHLGPEAVRPRRAPDDGRGYAARDAEAGGELIDWCRICEAGGGRVRPDGYCFDGCWVDRAGREQVFHGVVHPVQVARSGGASRSRRPGGNGSSGRLRCHVRARRRQPGGRRWAGSGAQGCRPAHAGRLPGGAGHDAGLDGQAKQEVLRGGASKTVAASGRVGATAARSMAAATASAAPPLSTWAAPAAAAMVPQVPMSCTPSGVPPMALPMRMPSRSRPGWQPAGPRHQPHDSAAAARLAPHGKRDDRELPCYRPAAAQRPQAAR